MGSPHGIRLYLPASVSKLLYITGLRETADLTVIEAIIILLIFLILIIFLASQSGSSNTTVSSNGQVSASFYRSLGTVAQISFAALIVPVTRHSPLLSYLNISFETILKLHRALGIFVYIVVAAHGFGVYTLSITYYTTQTFLTMYKYIYTLLYMCRYVVFICQHSRVYPSYGDDQ